MTKGKSALHVIKNIISKTAQLKWSSLITNVLILSVKKVYLSLFPTKVNKAKPKTLKLIKIIIATPKLVV